MKKIEEEEEEEECRTAGGGEAENDEGWRVSRAAVAVGVGSEESFRANEDMRRSGPRGFNDYGLGVFGQQRNSKFSLRRVLFCFVFFWPTRRVLFLNFNFWAIFQFPSFYSV